MSRRAVYELHDISLENDALMLHESIFHNANGYIGVRSNFEEGYPDGYDSIRGSYLNGFYDYAEMKQAEKLYGMVEEKQTILNVADTQTIFLYLEDEVFSMYEGTVLSGRRWVDMEAGCTGRQVVWRSPKGKEVEITIKRMTSFVRTSLFTIEYAVKALNFDGEITFVSKHEGDVSNYSNPDDPRVAAKSARHLIPVSAKYQEDVSYVVTNTSKSNLKVCTAVKNQLQKGKGECREQEICGHGAEERIETHITRGATVTLVKYSIFCDSIRHRDCKQQAEEELKQALGISLEKHYEEQKAYLANYWEQSALEIEGDEELSLAVRYNLYQLVQSVSKDEYGNIAAKGLSGEGYEGHYFWDTEMYIQPFFVLTNPDISRNLISYRYKTLDEARENARICGHKKGALYPWRTIEGSECSGYFVSGTAQYHINGDIAHAVVAYYLATKDMEFIADQGAEIIFETARLWMDAGNYHRGQFHIHEVTGPDEYTCMVDNNYYTNVCAQYNLHWAVIFYRQLKDLGRIETLAKKLSITEQEVADFEQAEKNMYLPYDEELGINPQDDTFLQKPVWDIEGTPKENFPLLLHYHPLYLYRHQVCKQADTVLAHFIFEDAQDMETIQKSFAYYEKITTHDSSLSTCIYSIVAAKLGLYDKAYEYFGDSAKLDLWNTHHNTKDGIHTANMGGTYMTIVYGFGGLRLKESGLYLAPLLPEQWQGYQFRINYEGTHIQVEIDQEVCILRLLSGEAKELHLYGRKLLLENTVTAKRVQA